MTDQAELEDLKTRLAYAERSAEVLLAENAIFRNVFREAFGGDKVIGLIRDEAIKLRNARK